jgi:hypothetical protein
MSKRNAVGPRIFNSTFGRRGAAKTAPSKTSWGELYRADSKNTTLLRPML